MHPIRHPAYLQTGDEFCDNTMRALTCDGLIPNPMSLRPLALPTGRVAWSGARAYLADTPSLPNLTRPVKQAIVAARITSLTRRFQAENVDFLCIWRGLLGRSAVGARAARNSGVRCAFFERGPLPGWLQIDMQGVNARNSVPREPGFFQKWRQDFKGPMTDWRALGATLTARKPRRELVRQDKRDDWSGEGRFLFVPFQLNAPGDPLPDAGWVQDTADLVAALARASLALPPGWHLRLKPHPNARGDLARLIARHPGARLILDKDTNSLDQLRASQGVITVNSAMGIEAFFFDKPVIVLGDSYYGGHGRTQLATSTEALADLLSRPEDLSFDIVARDDLLSFLFSDYFVAEETLRNGAFTARDLLSRHARLAAS